MYPAFVVIIVNKNYSVVNSFCLSTAARGDIEGQPSVEGRLESLAFAPTSTGNTPAVESPKELSSPHGPANRNLGVAESP